MEEAKTQGGRVKDGTGGGGGKQEEKNRKGKEGVRKRPKYCRDRRIA